MRFAGRRSDDRRCCSRIQATGGARGACAASRRARSTMTRHGDCARSPRAGCNKAGSISPVDGTAAANACTQHAQSGPPAFAGAAGTRLSCVEQIWLSPAAWASAMPACTPQPATQARAASQTRTHRNDRRIFDTVIVISGNLASNQARAASARFSASCSSRQNTLPVAVFGRSSTNSTTRGTLNAAM